MAKVTLIECDNCGSRIEGKSWKARVTHPGSRTAHVGDLCDPCAKVYTNNFRTEKREVRTNGEVPGQSSSDRASLTDGTVNSTVV